MLLVHHCSFGARTFPCLADVPLINLSVMKSSADLSQFHRFNSKHSAFCYVFRCILEFVFLLDRTAQNSYSWDPVFYSWSHQGNPFLIPESLWVILYPLRSCVHRASFTCLWIEECGNYPITIWRHLNQLLISLPFPIQICSLNFEVRHLASFWMELIVKIDDDHRGKYVRGLVFECVPSKW